MRALLFSWILGSTLVAARSGPKVILTLIVDDLGYYDTQINNPHAPTPTIGSLADKGIRLDRHYAYYSCSPTRRSFLSGRLPVHVGANQAGSCTNFLPLNFTLLSGKLKQAGFMNHYVGKGHLGYQTVDHLPINRGFDSHVGYMHADEDYDHGNFSFKVQKGCFWNKDFWHDNAPGEDVIDDIAYSTNWYSEKAVNIIEQHDAAKPLWLNLMYQAVHNPYTDTLPWERVRNNRKFCNGYKKEDGVSSFPSLGEPHKPVSWAECQVFTNMLHVLDNGIANVTNALKAKGLWDQTLVIFSSDNGGVGPGNNHPLRGQKKESWEGGVRVAAFLSGGYVPASLHGKRSDAVMHIIDWYATLSTLVGVDPSDTAHSPYEIDSVNMWPLLTGETNENPRDFLPLTVDAAIWKGQYKLITDAVASQLYLPNNTRILSPLSCSAKQPCLFDLLKDPSESVNIYSDNLKIGRRMQNRLSKYEQYTTKSMSDAELEPYTCVREPTKPKDEHDDPGWFKGWPWAPPHYQFVYNGPCCQRKKPVEPREYVV